MVATDTVVGIVGAVLLVAVMAGVFVYEYNNPAEDSGEDHEVAHFEQDYPGITATDDLDGDGQANYLDDDVDGDGTPNDQDMDAGVAVPVSGNLGQRTTAQAPFTLAFTVANGTEHLMGSITYTRTGTAALGLPTFAARILDASGSAVANAASTTSGNTVTMAFDVDGGDLPAGEYTLEVSQPNPGPGGSFSGELDVHYPWPAESPHAH